MNKLLVLVFCSLIPTSAAHSAGGKTVTIDCGKGQRAGAVGSYGGDSFSLNCSSGRTSTTTVMPAGTAWNIRMGVEDKTAGYDCLFFGDSETVSVSCAGTTVTVQ